MIKPLMDAVFARHIVHTFSRRRKIREPSCPRGKLLAVLQAVACVLAKRHG
jgi:hypothetical protein